uniref:Bestrophin homolog n=1 Tax=Cacopsylla melanoneura TaxID=428564 RepID=A0A8D8TBC3_9HEMI
MTVTYTAEVASCKGFGCFLKLLARWKGSIYKLVWPDLMAYLTLYYALNLTYRYQLNPDQKKIFESIVEYCDTYSNLIPLSFVLGFYISIIMTRWWDQYNNIPWPDATAVYVSSQVHGQDERGRMMRRTIMRYVCTCITMVLANISPRVKKRFPSLDHLVEGGLLLENEKNIIAGINEKFPGPPKHWMPIVWAASIVTRARKEGRVRDDFSVKSIIDELNRIRGQCGKLLGYDTVSVPLVYTQVVTLAVYSFLITTIMGRQWLDVSNDISHPLRIHNNYIDVYFPIFTILQFFFYMGWLKVAEVLINPFGDDDEDFEVNWMIDRNIQVSYLIVDGMHHEHPDLVRDQYWDDVFPSELPYTSAAEPFREKVPLPSTANIAVDQCGTDYINPTSVKVEGSNNPNYALLQEDNQSERNFIMGSMKLPRREREKSISCESTASMNTVGMGSIASSLNKLGSMQTLKKIFGSSDNTNKQTCANDGVAMTKPSQSSDNLSNVKGGGTSLKITDQVIEELDEQMTITASGRLEPRKPAVQDIFSDANIPSSLPIDVPNNPNSKYPRNRPTSSAHSSGTYAEIFSGASTTPNEENFDLGAFENDMISSGGSSAGTSSRRNSYSFKDAESKAAFENLKRSRQQEKMSVKLVRSISAAPSQMSDPNELDKPSEEEPVPVTLGEEITQTD